MTVPPQGSPENSGAPGIDLSAARSVPASARTGHETLPADGVAVPALVFDADEAGFNSLVELSAQVPVVVDLWADWCQPCKQLGPILERVVESRNGAVVLAKVDVDANPRIQQLFQAQSIPTVVAIIQGQPVPLFQGALPEPQVSQYIDELLKLAAANGVTGRAVVIGDEAPAEEPVKHPEALAALEAGDLDTARGVYEAALTEAPADADAKLGLARVGLLERTRGLTLEQARQAAANAPESIDAQLAVADLDVAGGHVDDAFARLLELLRRLAGDDRDQVRLRLLELFDVVGAEDPRTVRARAALMRALF